MPFLTRSSMLAGSLVVVAAVAVAGGFAWSGIYNIGADDTHTRPVYAALQFVRDRSITARARKLHPPPNLDDPALIRQGAGNYDAMCIACHLGPGTEATELSRGLYPSPPDLSQSGIGDPSHHFWVIKHGIKASGMPAWGKSMSDEYIWNMVAFLKVLPTLDAERYRAMVASSGGHSHGGGETVPHDDGAAAPDDHGKIPIDDLPMVESNPHDHPPGTAPHQDESGESHADAAGTPGSRQGAPKPAASTVEHRHADGTVEVHPTSDPAPAPADDGHEHQH